MRPKSVPCMWRFHQAGRNSRPGFFSHVEPDGLAVPVRFHLFRGGRRVQDYRGTNAESGYLSYWLAQPSLQRGVSLVDKPARVMVYAVAGRYSKQTTNRRFQKGTNRMKWLVLLALMTTSCTVCTLERDPLGRVYKISNGYAKFDEKGELLEIGSKGIIELSIQEVSVK